MRSVIITLPKGMQKSTIVGADFNLTSLLNNNNNFKQQQLQNIGVKMEPEYDDMEYTDNDDVKQDGWSKGKKRRLDHLTWEEKLQRKKLKNRVAAQTSRDRKKAKLDELEDTVRALKESNDMLTEECSLLRSQNDTLMAETLKLRKECEINKNKIDNNYCKKCHDNVNCNATSLGSAVSPINPLPQGGAIQMASLMTPNAKLIIKIMILYFLSTKSLNIYKEQISMNSMNLQKIFCEKLQPKFKQILINLMNRPQLQKIPLKNLTIQKEWWGRHQKMWTPVESVKA